MLAELSVRDELTTEEHDKLHVILDVTERHLEASGEHGLRIMDIARESGVSTSTLYYHFNDREGLIQAVQARAIRRVSSTSLNRLFEKFRQEHQIDQDVRSFANELVAVIGSEVDEYLSEERRRKVELMAAGITRPGLEHLIQSEITHIIDDVTAFCQVIYDRGWLAEGVTPRAMASALRAVLLGRVVGDYDLTPISDEEWYRLAELSILSLFRLE